MSIERETLEEYESLGRARRLRVRVDEERRTTIHVAEWPMHAVRLSIVQLEPPRALQTWCAEAGVREALNGGFFTKPQFHPLGELRIDGRRTQGRSFESPWDAARGAIRLSPDGAIQIDRRDSFVEEVTGDLLQASPLLVRDGAVVVDPEDPEGLSSTCHEFDSDITAEPLPRSAIGTTADSIIAISADGRSEDDDGLLLDELARVLVELGARAALNLDGGSSSSLVTGGVRRNNPRDDSGAVLEDGYPTPSAFVIEAR